MTETRILEKPFVLRLLIRKSHVCYDDGCFLFPTITKHEPGCLSIEGRKYKPSRLSAWIFHDLDLDSKNTVNHKLNCPNRNCWAPNHVYIGTQQSNMQDRIDSGNNPELSKTHCLKGHEYTAENTYVFNGKRDCKECKKSRTLESDSKRKGRARN
jgi:hypothetical protein